MRAGRVPSNDDRDETFGRFWEAAGGRIEGATSLQSAAQRFCEQFYAAFSEFAVLVRVFATVPLEGLKLDDAEYVRTFAREAGRLELLGPETAILTLLGTYGIEPAWRARTTSRGHRAIPLLSDEFVGEIPMIARLLAELGFPKLHSGSAAWQFVRRVGGDAGLFFVGDAPTTTDERGRRIIPSAEFVDRYGVRTVFGAGGAYEAAPIFLSAIVFCRRTLMRSDAEAFVPLVGQFKSHTTALVLRQAIFEN